VKLDNPITATLAGLIDNLRTGAPQLGDVGDLGGRTCLVTGANSGLGKAVAIDLARRGARVLMACRSGIPEAGEEVKAASGSQTVEMLPVDLSDFASVHRLCDQLRDRQLRLDVTVLNAGVMPRRAQRTKQGFELMFQVNYLANVVLLDRLLSDGVIANRAFGKSARGNGVTAGRRPRIVIVASEVHRTAKPLDLATLGDYVEYGVLDGTAQYGYNKLALCTFATELSRRLRSDGGVDVAVHALCPGPVDSNMTREAPKWILPILKLITRKFFAAPAVAARPVVYLAGADEIEGQTGLYLHMTRKKEAAPHARDAAIGRQLWDVNQRLIERAALAKRG
jgi:NAD(P)-dependent dehydrogenase (short-subunit alcohol dehydrogenase family)